MVKILTAILLLIPSVLWAACPAPVGTTYTAVDVSAAEVQDCIDDAEAASGGTVVIPAGTATYDATHYISKTVTKNLTIQGAGSGLDGTVITDGGANKDIPAITLVANGTVTLVIKKIRLVTKTAVTNDGGSMNIYGVSPNKVINNIYFDMTGITGGRMLKLGSYSDASHGYGVVHGCTFYNTTDKGQSVSIFGQAQGSTWSWSGNPGFGTANAWFIEGNTFTNTTGDGDGHLDAYAGAKIVWRYNTQDGSGVGWHGNDSSTGLHSIEVYKNVLNDTGNVSVFSIGGRGGTGLLWGNVLDANIPGTFILSNYRSCDVGGKSSDLCDGSGADDENSDATGYRCYQQIGSTGTDGLTQWPIIEWDNTVNGTANNGHFALNPSFLGAACVAYGHGATYDMADHVQEGRDFINHDTCVGVTSDFCTAWWDDVNKKGKLNGSAYTPYTGTGECPHPLTGLTGTCTSEAGTTGYNVATARTVTPSGTNCTVSPNTAQTITDGNTTTFTMTAAYGYTASAGGTCGGTLSSGTYTTSAITADCTVTCTGLGKRGVLGGTGLASLGGTGVACLSDLIALSYNGNESTSGTVPNTSRYCAGQTVTVLDNTGTLAKTGYAFDGWNTAADGSGTSYSATDTFTISGATTLYAKWAALIPIDIGSAATDRGSTGTAAITFLDKANPVEASGTITSVELWFETDATGVKVGSFYGSATTYTNRASTTIGNVTSGSKQTVAVNFAVESGDIIGIYCATGGISFDGSGGTAMLWKNGDQMGAGSQNYSNLVGYQMSVYGTGTE